MNFSTEKLPDLIPTDKEAQAAFDVIARYTERKLSLLEQAAKERDKQADLSMKHHTEQMAATERIFRSVLSIQNDLLRLMPSMESVFALATGTAGNQMLIDGRLGQVEKTVEDLQRKLNDWKRSVIDD